MEILKGKKAIIFDLDGTLVDSLEMWNEVDKNLILAIASQQVKKQLLADSSWIENIYSFRIECLRKHQSKDMYKEYVNELIKKYDSAYTAPEVNKMRDTIAEYYMINQVLPKKGVLDILPFLKINGYYLVLATSSTVWALNIYSKNMNINSRFNLFEMFDLILTKDDVQNKKPHPEIYIKAIMNSGCKVEECLVFEDSLEGVEAANSALIDVISLYDKHSDQDRERINQMSLLSCKDFTEVLEMIESNNIPRRKYEI